MTDLIKQGKNKKARRANQELSSMIYGKIPPQAKDLEEAILGAIMLERNAFDEVAEILKPECFYFDSHQRIFKAMSALRQKNSPIDILTVTEELRAEDTLETIGGAYYLTRLTDSVVSSAHIETHSRIVLEKFLKRELIRVSGELIGNAYEDGSDVFDIMDDFENHYTQLTTTRHKNKLAPLDKLLVDRLQRIEQLRKSESHVTGVPSGFRDIDRLTHGFQDTDLIILAARPGVGKTALALNIARNAAMNRIKPAGVAFFSLEMSAGQLVDRLMAAQSEIWLEKITSGLMQDSDMQTLYKGAIQPLAKEAKLFIDDTPAINVFELRAAARRLIRKHQIGLIIIDYLQLMSGDGDRRSGNREQEISTISRNLKALAKELEIPIIALSQLSRETEKRKGEQKMPQLSDLRESGAIEQDADMVMFLYRPDYYDMSLNEMGENIKGETHVIIAKNRHGKLAKGNEAIKLRAELPIQKFFDWDSQAQMFEAGRPGIWRPVQSDKDDLPFGN